MDIKHVDGEIVGRQVHRLKDLLQCHGLAVPGLADGRVGFRLQGLLDEAQQVFLIHGGCSMDVSVNLQSR